MEKFLFHALDLLSGIIIVGVAAWLFKPNVSDGDMWFIAALFGVIYARINWTVEKKDTDAS